MSFPKTEKLIKDIEEELNSAVDLLSEFRAEEDEAIADALAGDFEAAIKSARDAGRALRAAKLQERIALRLIIRLIGVAKAEGVPDDATSSVIQSLLAKVQGA